MPQPFLATWRIVINYVVNGLPHEQRYYVQIVDPLAVPPTIDQRGALPALSWQDAAAAAVVTLQSATGTGTVVSNCLLQQLSGTQWILVDSFTPAFTPSAFAPSLAGQLTVTLRNNAPVPQLTKVVVLEPFWTIPTHYTTPSQGSGGEDTFLAQFTSLFTVPNAPWNWMIGRNAAFMLQNPFIAATGTYNRELRRARGLA